MEVRLARLVAARSPSGAKALRATWTRSCSSGARLLACPGRTAPSCSAVDCRAFCSGHLLCLCEPAAMAKAAGRKLLLEFPSVGFLEKEALAPKHG